MKLANRANFFVNGTGMRGGELHSGLGSAEFICEAETAPNYKFFAHNRSFPGLKYVDEGGTAIAGEVYSVELRQLFEIFLPAEPQELELSMISLADDSHVFSMIVRTTMEDAQAWEDISHFGGWRAFRSSLKL